MPPRALRRVVFAAEIFANTFSGGNSSKFGTLRLMSYRKLTRAAAGPMKCKNSFAPASSSTNPGDGNETGVSPGPSKRGYHTRKRGTACG